MAAFAHLSLTNSHSLASPAPLVARLGSLFRTWQEKRHGWETYGRMNDRDVQDTGLTRWEIECELARPFWRD